MAKKDSTSNTTIQKACKAAPEAPKAHTRRKTKGNQPPQPVKLARERISAQGWEAYHEYVGNLTEAEMRVVGHLLPFTFPSPQAVINEARCLLGESAAKCKVIPFPAASKEVTL